MCNTTKYLENDPEHAMNLEQPTASNQSLPRDTRVAFESRHLPTLLGWLAVKPLRMLQRLHLLVDHLSNNLHPRRYA